MKRWEMSKGEREAWDDAEPSAMLDDLREAVTTLEETERIVRRVFGATHPLTARIEDHLRNARAALRAREEAVRRRDSGEVHLRSCREDVVGGCIKYFQPLDLTQTSYDAIAASPARPSSHYHYQRGRMRARRHHWRRAAAASPGGARAGRASFPSH